MCISDFLRRRRERREAFVKSELGRYSESTRKEFLQDNSMTNRQKYGFLLQMSRYNNKYTKLLGEEKTAKLFKGLDYSEVKAMYDLKKEFGNILKPSEINNMYQAKEMRAKRLEKGIEVLREKIAKVYGEDFEAVFPIHTQLHNLKTYYRYKDELVITKDQLKILGKVNNVTKDLAKFEIVPEKKQNSFGKAFSRLFSCCSNPKTMESRGM